MYRFVQSTRASVASDRTFLLDIRARTISETCRIVSGETTAHVAARVGHAGGGARGRRHGMIKGPTHRLIVPCGTLYS